MFQVDISATPPPLTVVVGEASFELQHRYMAGLERLRVLEALSRSISQGVQESWVAIIGWRNVVQAGGAPLGMWYEEDGVQKSRLDQVMGRVPIFEQIKVLLFQLAMNGVVQDSVTEVLIAACADGNDQKAESLKKEMASFLKSPAGKPGKSSGGSATTETSSSSPA